MKRKLLVHAFAIEKKADTYYLQYCHWIYIKEISSYYDEVVILAGCRYLQNEDAVNISIAPFKNVSVCEIPMGSGSYISSIKYFFSYLKAYRSISGITTFYSRYPTPFGWLQKIYGNKVRRIIHYVGDPVDAARNNPNFSFWKKLLLINGFYVENALYNWACKGAEVFTNGPHLAHKLRGKGIEAIALISSTLTGTDFYFAEKEIQPETARFIYLGYLRTAKGVETLIHAFEIYNAKYPASTLVIIGSGEFEEQLKNMAASRRVRNISFMGRVEDRQLINRELRSSDVFLFASLSEGSPRVILEAMASGLAVISTPVGSLPATFENEQDIIFSNFNDYHEFAINMERITSDNSLFNRIRSSSYVKVQDATIDKFLKKIFLEKPPAGT